MNQEKTDYVRYFLSESDLKKAGLFDFGRVSRLVKKLEATKDPSEVNGMALVGILSAQLVHQHFIEDFPSTLVRPAKPCIVVDKRTRPRFDLPQG